jgi:adenylate kinase family enzyme
MITGDMIRLKLSTDAKFKSDWKKHVDSGNLLPDSVLSPMVRSRYDVPIRHGRENIFWDGWHRTVPQVDEFFRSYTTKEEKVTVVYINGSKQTCRERNNFRNRIADRTDGGSFDARWQIYEDNTPNVLNAFERHSINVVMIDGNIDLDMIARLVWAQWCRFTGINEPMPEIKRREVPAREPMENHGNSRIPVSMLAAA